MRAVVRIVAGLAVLGAVAVGGAAAFAATPNGVSLGDARGEFTVQPDATAIEYGLIADASATEYGVHSDATPVEYGLIADASATEY